MNNRIRYNNLYNQYLNIKKLCDNLEMSFNDFSNLMEKSLLIDDLLYKEFQIKKMKDLNLENSLEIDEKIIPLLKQKMV